MTALCGAVGTCAGAWVKVFSVHPDLFYVGFIGQTIVATSQVINFYTFRHKHVRFTEHQRRRRRRRLSVVGGIDS